MKTSTQAKKEEFKKTYSINYYCSNCGHHDNAEIMRGTPVHTFCSYCGCEITSGSKPKNNYFLDRL